ncbi:HD-GYP domain-containing protein [uncultured Gammaproteobacteria bacterium]
MFSRTYHQLLRRLALAAVVISAGVGGLTWWHEIERMDDAIVAFAVDEAGTFVSLHQNVFNPARGLEGGTTDGASALLSQFLATRAEHGAGHFHIAEIYDTQRRKFAEATHGEYEEIEQAFNRIVHVFPEHHDATYDKITLGPNLYIRVVTEARDAAGAEIGFFEGIFHVSNEHLAGIRLGVARTVVVVIAGVALATLLLFPTIVTLNRNLVAANQQLLSANLEMLEVLGGAIAKRDSDTNAHNYRVTLYAVRLAEEAGLAPEAIRELIKGAFLHDVGKIAISDSILLKPGKLTAAEFEIMKTHVSHGRDIVSRSKWLQGAASVVEGHHEKYDGSGYPHGLRGEEISLLARVFAIADVFDALASRRPYKDPMPLDKAMAIIAADAGSHFDPRLTAVFSTIAPKLHASLTEREEAGLTEDLLAVVSNYFATI